MTWYNTGTIAVSGTTVTGTGTNWLDNKFAIGPGQALLIPGSGTVKMYEIKSVDSATKITLMTSPGTIAAGQAYSIMSFYTDSVPDFARRLAAQLSYYQTQMDGWQKIMTSSGAVTLTAPDGTSVTVSSFAKLTADVGNAMQAGTFGFGTSSLSAGAIDWQQFEFLSGMNLSYVTGADTNQPAGFPVLPANYGAYVTVIGRSGTTIHMILTITSANNGLWNMYAMTLTGAKGARALAVRTLMGMENFGYQYGVGATNVTTQSAFDFQQADFIVGAHYTVSSSIMTNAPAQMSYAAGTGVVILVDFITSSSGRIGLTIIPNTASDSNFKVYKLLGVGDKGSRVWSVRQEWNSTDVVPVANGGTGGSTQAAARTGLGLGNAATLNVNPSGADPVAGAPIVAGSQVNSNNTIAALTFASNITPPMANVTNGTNAPGFRVSNGANNSASAAMVFIRDGAYATLFGIDADNQLKIGGWSNGANSYVIWSQKNTTVDGNGFIKKASPIVRVTSNVSKMPAGFTEGNFTQTDYAAVNDEAEGVTVERVDVGLYHIAGTAGLYPDGWTLEIPQDENGNRLCYASISYQEGVVILNVAKRKFDVDSAMIVAGDPVDVPDGRWIDVRVAMPGDSVFNQKAAQATVELREYLAAQQKAQEEAEQAAIAAAEAEALAEAQAAAEQTSQQSDELPSEPASTDTDLNDQPEI